MCAFVTPNPSRGDTELNAPLCALCLPGRSCEFLKKLDLTINFVDFDTLEESIEHLKPRVHLRELFLMGNPAQQKWADSLKYYVVHSLPQLASLDGVDIPRSLRITAAQKFPSLQQELHALAEEVRLQKAREREEAEDADVPKVVELNEEGEEITKHCPETRYLSTLLTGWVTGAIVLDS